MKTINFKNTWCLIVTVAFLALGCSSDDNNGGNNAGEWIIPQNEVFDGGPGKDGIPSIDNPNFSAASEINFLNDNDVIIAVESNGVIRGYPHPVLDWHEIINDRIGGTALAITHCPLTGTSLGWDRVIDGDETTFGVSGLLYNSNLIPYDRKTDSNWSQIRQDCVEGELVTRKAEQYPMIELNWSTFLAAYPDAEVVNTDTGAARDYGRYPYGDYKSNNGRIIFPVSDEDDRVPNKERVLAILNGDDVKTYRFKDFSDSGSLVEDSYQGTDLVVVGNNNLNYLVAYEKEVGSSYTFLADEFPFVMEDNSGAKIDIFGRKSTGGALRIPDQLIGFWFSFPAFFEDVEIFNQ